MNCPICSDIGLVPIERTVPFGIYYQHWPCECGQRPWLEQRVVVERTLNKYERLGLEPADIDSQPTASWCKIENFSDEN